MRAGLWAAGALLAVWAIAASPANATHVKCGDVLTQDTTLDSDLLECSGDGVVIGASGITLDLGGHLIDGPDPTPAFGFDPPPDGVNNRAGHHDLTVRNGALREFQNGIAIRGLRQGPTLASGIVVTNMDISSVRGFAVERTTGLRIEGNVIKGIDNAMRVLDSRETQLIANHVDSISGGGHGGLVRIFPFEFGIQGEDVAERNVILHGGLTIGGVGSMATRNTIRDGGEFAGIAVGGGSLVARNVISGQVIGISQGGLSASLTRIVKNEVSDSTLDGIRTSGNAELEHNSSVRALDDGIDVDEPGATLTKNRADDNGDLGIEAVAGTTDGRNNKASGNGNPAQCTGVVCK